jgi:UDP-glucuronate 4-epimerase
MLPVYGDGSTARDYTYIDDIVLGVGAAVDFLRARPSTYEIVNLGESQTVSLSEMVEVVSSEMGIEAKIQRLPMQPGDVMRTHADLSKARRLLGYDPTTDFRAGVKKFVEWFREEGKGLPADARG